MDVANELLDAIEIIVDKKIRENTAQIYPGICKSVSGSSCVMSINGKDNTIRFYGSIPTVGAIYRVFVPSGNMSMAFAITGNDDRKGLQYSNPNLLDNWYFGNPVNQKGQTEYTEAGYTIDRWYGSSLASITLESDGVLFVKRGNGIPVISTPLEKERFVNGYYTISVCYYVDNKLELSKNTFYLTVGETIDTDNINVGSSWYMDFYASSQDVSNGIYRLRFYNPSGAIDDGCKLLAAKLELGSQQTLAHQDADGNWSLNEIPDYGEQLARCQRYFQLYSTADNRPSKAVDCRPTMRIDPSQGTIIIDGTTYYYNTADLQGVYMGLLKEL